MLLIFRCATLEGERNTSFQRISELTSIENHLQLTLETLLKEKDSLNSEYETALHNIEALENKAIELTNEIVTLVKEKETSDNTVRLLQRTVASHEKERENIRVQIESLQNQNLFQNDWSKEREVLLL